MHITLESVCAALNAKRVDDEWLALCPAHNDHHPSLALARGSKVPVIFTCRAGCSQAAVLAAVQKKLSTASPVPHSTNVQKEEVAPLALLHAPRRKWTIRNRL